MSPSVAAPHYQLYVGIDIAAASFDASWLRAGGPRAAAPTFPHTAAGFTALQAHLATTDIAPAQTLVVLEATGSYWIALAATLHASGYAVAVVNPAQAYNYAKSLPRRNKTDALDAQLLARFAAERQPTAWTPPAAVSHELRQRFAPGAPARDGLLEMRGAPRARRATNCMR